MSESNSRPGLRIIAVIVSPILLALLLVYMLPEPDLSMDPMERARLNDEAGNSIGAMHELRRVYRDHPEDQELNRAFIYYLYGVPGRSSRGDEIRNSKEIRETYQKQCSSSMGSKAVLGCYYLGLMHKEEEDFTEAKRYLEEAMASRVPFAAADLAEIYEDGRQYQKAERLFRKELETGTTDSREEALRGLSRVLADQQDWTGLQSLLDRSGPDALSHNALQRYRLASGDLLNYVRAASVKRITSLHPLGVAATIFILIGWSLVLYNWRGILSAVPRTLLLAGLAGLITGILAAMLSGIIAFWIDTNHSSSVWLNAVNSYFTRAFLPEALKIGAVVLLARRIGESWKPLDWLMHMAACGLGYAGWLVLGSVRNGEYGDALSSAMTFIPLYVFLGGSLGLFISEYAKRNLSFKNAIWIAIGTATLVTGTIFFVVSLGSLISLFAWLFVLQAFFVFMLSRPQAQFLSDALPNKEDVHPMEMSLWPFAIQGLVTAMVLIWAGLQLPRDTYWHSAMQLVVSGVVPCSFFFIASLPIFPTEWEPRWYLGILGMSGDKGNRKERSISVDSSVEAASQSAKKMEALRPANSQAGAETGAILGSLQGPSFWSSLLRMGLTFLGLVGVFYLSYNISGGHLLGISLDDWFLVPMAICFIYGIYALYKLDKLSSSVKSAELISTGLRANLQFWKKAFVPYEDILGIVVQGPVARVEHMEGELFIHNQSSNLGWFLETLMERSPYLEEMNVGLFTLDQEIWGKEPNRQLYRDVRKRIRDLKGEADDSGADAGDGDGESGEAGA